jgi:Arc/MetJ family transcription regulator
MSSKDFQGVRDGEKGMTNVTVSLPDELAQTVQQAGLLSSTAIAQLLEEAVHRQAGRQLLDAMQRLRDAKEPSLTEDDVAAAIAAVRRQISY